jgi:cell division protease FtsH
VKQTSKNILLWVFLGVIFLAIYQTLQGATAGERWPFSKFYAVVERSPGELRSVVVRGDEIEGQTADNRRFRTTGDFESVRDRLLASSDVKVEYESQEQSQFWLSVITTWLPMIFLFVIFFLFMRQLQAGGGKAMSFGKSRHRLLNESSKRVTFADVAGIDEAKDELQEIIEFLRDPKKFTRLGGRIPKGVLLMGPPGTGKTLLARGVAGEAGVPFFSISGSDFVEMFVGVGASRVRDLFEQGKKHAPCIIFIDEIDAVGRHRGAGLGGGHDEREQTLNQLLVEMDGFEANDGVILVAATNRPDVLDPALLRPGRFDRRVVVPLPDVGGREAILVVHTRKKRIGPDVDLTTLAKGTPGFSGADLENLVNEAALLAARFGKDYIGREELEDAKDKVMMGSERRSMILTEDEKRRTAYHEAGHALVAKFMPNADPVHKVTIIPRGRALGLTTQLPEKDRHSYHKAWLEDFIAVAMGGRVADELVFGELSTGARQDIESASGLARRMVCEWGMSMLGPIAFGKREEQIFLGREISRSQDYSEATAIRIDREVKRFMIDGYERAHQVLREHRAELDRLASALLEFETIDSEELGCVMGGGDLSALRAEREAAARKPTAGATPGGGGSPRPAEVGDAGSGAPPRRPGPPKLEPGKGSSS